MRIVREDLVNQILENTQRSVASDDFSHAEDAYNAGVCAAVEEVYDYFKGIMSQTTDD